MGVVVVGVGFNQAMWARGRKLERAFFIEDPARRDRAVDKLMGLRDWYEVLRTAILNPHGKLPPCV